MLSARIDARRAHSGLARLPGEVAHTLHAKARAMSTGSKSHALNPALAAHILPGALHTAPDAKAEALRQAGVRPAHPQLPDKHEALAFAIAGRDALGRAIHPGSHAGMMEHLRHTALHAARQALHR